MTWMYSDAISFSGLVLSSINKVVTRTLGLTMEGLQPRRTKQHAEPLLFIVLTMAFLQSFRTKILASSWLTMMMITNLV